MTVKNARTGYEFNDSYPYQVRKVKTGSWFNFKDFFEMYDFIIKEKTMPSNIRYKGANIRMLVSSYLPEDCRNTDNWLFDTLYRNIETRVNKFGVYE